MKGMIATAFLGLLGVTGCDDGKPITLESTRIRSPDGQSVAIVELVDNGLGFGQGIAYDEVHVGDADFAATVHGDPDQSAIFYASQESSTDTRPEVQWVDAKHLLVVYDAKRRPHKLLRTVGGIEIEYRGALRHEP